MKTIENTKDYVGDTIRVSKSDFEIFEYISGYFGICLKNNHGGNCIWGGDSAFEDCYDLNLAGNIFEKWDGQLEYDNNYGYTIDTSNI